LPNQATTDTPSKPIATTQIPGLIFVLLAAVLWSTSGFFTQTTLLKVWSVEVRGPAIALWRALFALVLLLPLVRRVSWHWAMIPMMICFVAMNWTFLSAMVSGSPANTIWLQNLAPAWVMLGAVVLFGERTTLRDWTMLLVCISGVIFILVMENLYGYQSSEHRWWSPWLAIASGLTYAGVILSIRVLRHHDSAWLVALNHMATFLVMAPLVWWSGASIPTGAMWLLLAGIGMLQMGLPYLLFARGLKSTPSHIASMITLLEPVLLPVWVHLTRMGDPEYRLPQWWTWVGASCILLGLTIRYAWPQETAAVQASEG
jgi:drug/metabolite transporter, DME family